MKRMRLYIAAATAALLLTNCSKEGEMQVDEREEYIRFAIEKQADDSRVSATQFDDGDEVGLYAFFNNFFFYYPEWDKYAESVVFCNKLLTIYNDTYTATQRLNYSPLQTWTFSTIYGTPPNEIDFVAYYPYAASDCVDITNTTDEAHSVLNYSFDFAKNPHSDFMLAVKKYYSADADTFRTAMLDLGRTGGVTLDFKRQMAGMNFRVRNISSTDVTISSIDIYATNVKDRFTFDIISQSGAWSTTTTQPQYYRATVDKTLTAEAYSASFDGVPNIFDNIFLPPGATILKIVFNYTAGGVTDSYAWHPHIAPLTRGNVEELSLNLDTTRDN